MEGTIAQRDTSLLKKEEKIKELKLSVGLLQQELKLKIQSVDRLQADRKASTAAALPNNQVQDTKHESARDRRELDPVSMKLRSLSMTGASTPSSSLSQQQQQAKRPVLGDSNAVQEGTNSADVLNI